jgi:hypothetical protein
MNHLCKWQVALPGSHLHVAQISQLLECTQNNFILSMKSLIMFKPMPTLVIRWCHPNYNCPIWILYKNCGHFNTNMSRNTHIHKLVVAWMWMLLSFWLTIVSQESPCCIFGNACNKNFGCKFCMMVCPKSWRNYFYTYLHLCLGVDDVNGSYGNLVLIFKMK